MSKNRCKLLDSAACDLSGLAQRFQKKTCLLRVTGPKMFDPSYDGGPTPGDEHIEPFTLLEELEGMQAALANAQQHVRLLLQATLGNGR